MDEASLGPPGLGQEAAFPGYDTEGDGGRGSHREKVRDSRRTSHSEPGEGGGFQSTWRPLCRCLSPRSAIQQGPLFSLFWRR